MRKNNILIKITIFLFVISGFYSCMDDDSLSATQYFKENQFILKLPEKKVVDINTRGADSDDNGIKNILVAVIRSGKAEFEYVSSGIALESNGSITCTLTTLGPKTGETVYFFCNVDDLSSINVSTEDELLKSITCSSGTVDVMYGDTKIQTSDNTVDLRHSMSNIKVTLSTGISGYTIDSLLVCDVPAVGFASGQRYTTPDIEDVSFGNPNKSMFMVPRPDNGASGVTPTFLLAHLSTKGWYKLDFYKNENNIEVGTSPELLKIESNVFYKFEISSIKNDGYTTKEEARNNVSSNIVYNLSVDKNVSTSNGQYMLLADKEEIVLYPTKPGGVISISAVIPKGEIVTYKAKVHGGNIKILDSKNNSVDSLDLIEGDLTTGNSQRSIKFSPLGTWLQENDYLEITLGNIKKKIPFRFFTANSYLFDCGVNKSIKIPYFQANLDENVGGRVRINRNDNVVCELLWADQPNADFEIVDNKEAGWFEVKSKEASFIGNAVIAAKVNGEIKWSWHLWCMDNSIIEYDDNIGLYIYKDEKVQHYCTNEWMDRNLGAFNLNDLAGPGSRGLGYQWGRKDPFNTGGEFLDYVEDVPETQHAWPEGDLYTPSGVFTMYDVALFKSNNFPETGISTFYYQTTLSGKEALEYSIKNPFVQMATTRSEWRKDIRSDTWNASDGKKTPYDPCPIGWRVPSGTEDPNGPFYGLTLENRVGETKYGIKWRNDNGDEIYYPYVPFRFNGLWATAGPIVGGMIHAYNRSIWLLWGGFLSTVEGGGMTQYQNFTEFKGWDSEYPLNSFTQHVVSARADYALSVRCVRDKSVKY